MKIAIAGANGRMGQVLMRLVAENPRPFSLAGAIGSKMSSSELRKILHRADALVDFSIPVASAAYALLAAELKFAHIIGTTGFSNAQEKQILQAAKRTAIVKSGNMSLGVNLLSALVKQAAAKLGAEFDIEIVEMHHRNKTDAPSGTALLLGKAAAEGRKQKFLPLIDRKGKHKGIRKNGIGFASIRCGSVVGEHEVIFAGQSERIKLSHSAEDRSLFARGALKAALWAKNKKPGLYSMSDVLDLGKR